MIGIGIANSLGVNLSGINPATKSFMSATGISNPNEVKAINDLVTGLQADGIWSKMKAIYPFVTDNRNLLGYTEDFSNAAWSKGPNVTITGNTVVAPNGTLTADSINVTSTSAKYIFQDITYSGSHTFSIYAKYQSLQFIQLLISTDTTKFVNFDILNGLVTRQDNSVGVIENVGNGWFRCSISLNATSQTQVLLGIIGSGNATRVQSNSLIGTSYIWGAQLELGSTATTYQPIATTQQAYIANQFKFNLVNPVDSDAAFRLVFNGGWTHSAQGALPNGTNGYADTRFNQENNWSSNTNAAFGFYSRTDNSTTGVDIGALTNSITGSNGSAIYSRYGANNVIFSAVNSSIVASVANTNSLGFFVASRSNSTQHKIYKFGTTTINTTQTSALSTNINRNIYLGAANDLTLGTAASYSSRQQAFAFISDGLTDTQVTNLNTRVQAFQTALNRQV